MYIGKCCRYVEIETETRAKVYQFWCWLSCEVHSMFGGFIGGSAEVERCWEISIGKCSRYLEILTETRTEV
jgi:hypothetical protein